VIVWFEGKESYDWTKRGNILWLVWLWFSGCGLDLVNLEMYGFSMSFVSVGVFL